MACVGVVWVWGSAMADVFISYSKADRPLALKLAAMLEAEGWKVWWDTSLTIGDDFRNEINIKWRRQVLIGQMLKLDRDQLTISLSSPSFRTDPIDSKPWSRFHRESSRDSCQSIPRAE